jgi:hypothetical protein
MYYNNGGSYNVAVGNASNQAGSGSRNVHIGQQAGGYNTGTLITAVGNQAAEGLANNTNAGSYGTYIGAYSGQEINTGQVNNFFGYASGKQVTTGGKNTIVGSYQGNGNGLDIRTSSNNIVLSDGDGVIGMHINDSGAVHHPERGSNGDYTSYIGSVNNAGTSNRYIHVNISTSGGDMFWVEAIGYDYSANIIYGRSGGYIYNVANQTSVYAGVVSGSIVTQYQLTNGTLEIVIDTVSTGTTNRWGSIVLRGGTDTITASQILDVIQYSKTSTTTKVY